METIEIGSDEKSLSQAQALIAEMFDKRHLIAAAAAIVVGLVLSFVLDDAGRQQLAEQWVAPLENLFVQGGGDALEPLPRFG